jgi:hypothetical protein
LFVPPAIALEENRSAAPKTNVNTLEIFIYSSFKVSVAITVQDLHPSPAE